MVEFLIFIAPGSGLMFFILKFIKAKSEVTIARTGTVRAEARMEDARETARLALGQTTEALAIARLIEDVDTNVRYIVGRIDGEETAPRRGGKHSRPLLPSDKPAIGSGEGFIE